MTFSSILFYLTFTALAWGPISYFGFGSGAKQEYYQKNSENGYELVAETNSNAASLYFMYSWSGCGLRYFFKNQYAANAYARYMKSAWSKSKIEPFIKGHAIDLERFEKAKVDEYDSFNDFFIRKLSMSAQLDLEKRCGESASQNKVYSPADSKLLVIENIGQNTPFQIKGKQFSLETFLGDADLAGQYANGTMLIFRLAPYDYHRFHFPVSCMPGAPSTLGKSYESVNPIAYKSGVQPLTQNLRHMIKLENINRTGKQALMLPVGAMLVGSIKETFNVNTQCQAGQEAGYFEFGGSTVVLLFKKGDLTVEKHFLEHSNKHIETAVEVGEIIGSIV
ncbi:MAG: phosphatidylserine decarboxylase [Epsilonproteobacteria bacterium]|nr:phosphatidylserine decarboxylase [Campylobacterota bacterium]